MAAYVNTPFSLAGAESVIIPVNRWGYPKYSIQVETGSALVEGTLSQLNRGDTAVWDTLDDSGGTALTALTGLASVEEIPIEAIRITATGATSGRVMQSGDD
jgi:hypothetical protein